MSKARVISGYGETGSFKQVTVISNITMTAYTNYYVDTTSVAYTLTLPATATNGDEIHVFDIGNNAGAKNITIASNSGKINGTVQDLAIDVNGAAVVLIYTGSLYGWRAG
jgi:hypothetical protein